MIDGYESPIAAPSWSGSASGTETGPARPKIVLMGEFSAGKSTLINLMLGQEVLPTRITATRLPPVWLSYGKQAPFRQDLSGARHPVQMAELEDIPIEKTAFIRLFLDAEILRHCDLIDTPGLSDPNTPIEVWEGALGLADSILFLTHATQAWRRSEASVWAALPPQIQANSLLLVTRIDNILHPADKDRVLARVRAEAAGQFAEVLPISLSEAQAAGDDDDLWAASGGAAFSAALLRCLERLTPRTHPQPPAPITPAGGRG